jgi:ABC-type uncharacterized transport system auxiliary subunit
MKPPILIFAFTALALTLSNCGGVPPTYYYQIDYDYTSGENSSVLPLTLALGQFGADVLYESDKIVYRDSPYEVQFYHYRRWITQPEKLVTEKVFRQYRAAGRFQRVVRIPSVYKVDYILKGRITAFEEWDEGDSWFGVVTIEFQLHSLESNELVWEKAISEKTAAQQKDPANVVKAISESLKKVVDQSISEVAEHLKSNTI